MHATRALLRRTARATVRPVTGLLMALGLLVGPGAGAAAAHDALVGSTPTLDSVQQVAPDRVVLEFSGTPQPLGTEVVVTDPTGMSATQGAPGIEGSTVVQQLRGDLPAGRYSVDWRVISADGHPLSGTFTFSVAEGSGAPLGESTDAASVAPDAPVDPATASAGSSLPVVWLAVGAILLVAGALVVRQLRRPA